MYFIYVCSCTHLQLGDEHICSPYLSHMIFKYTTDINFKTFASEADVLGSLLDNVGGICHTTVVPFTCNIVFVPCNLTTGAPIPVCSNTCSSFKSSCTNSYDVLAAFSKFYGYPFTRNCENTLSHLNTDYGYLNSSSDFKDNCFSLPGMSSFDCNNVY